MITNLILNVDQNLSNFVKCPKIYLKCPKKVLKYETTFCPKILKNSMEITLGGM